MIHTVTFLILVRINIILLIVFKYLVLAVGNIASHGYTYLSDILLVFEVAVEATRPYSTHIGSWVVVTIKFKTCYFRQIFTFCINTGTFFIKVVHSQRELIIEQNKVYTDIILVCNFPSNIVRSHLCIMQSAIPRPCTTGQTKIILYCISSTPDVIKIGETDSLISSSHIIIPHLTMRITNLEHVQPRSHLLNDRFFTNIPRHRPCREKAPTMSVGKVLGTIITKVIIQEITILIIIGELTGQSHIFS